MISIYLSLAIATVLGAGWGFSPWGGLGTGITLGVIAFIATWIVIGRRFGKRIQPVMLQAQKHAEAGNAAVALKTVETLIPAANWIPMLKGQLYAQMGVLSIGAGKEDQAIEYLEKATNRAADAKLFLACFYHRKRRPKDCRRVLESARRSNRKHVLLHNVFAFVLYKEGDTDAAIATLNSLLAKVPENETTQSNLNRIKNGKKMSMKPFGMNWYSLGIERPPASMMKQTQDPRRGFRQQSKRRG